MRASLLRAVALAAAAIVAGCERGGERFEVRKRDIARLPIAWRRPSIHIANGGEHATFTARLPGGYAVVTPAGRGPTYADVSLPLFAPKSARVFYWATEESNGTKRTLLVADGVPRATEYSQSGTLALAKVGGRWAALGHVDPRPPALEEVRQAIVLVDGEERGRYAAASVPDFSDDGAHVVWVARGNDGRRILVVDGAESRAFDEPSGPPVPGLDAPFELQHVVRHLVDGRSLVVTQDRDGWAVMRAEERIASYGQSLVEGGGILLGGEGTPSAIVPASIVTAATAPVAVWWERRAGAEDRWRVVRDGAPVDGIECGRHWSVQTPVVTDDGRHVAYVCATVPDTEHPTGRRWVVLDGQRFGPYSEAWTIGLAEDGSKIAYGAAETLPVRQWRIYVNGEARTPFSDLVWRPRFTPDGRHVLWAAGAESGRRTLGFDERTVTRFDDIMFGPELFAPRSLAWVIRRDRNISRIELRY